LILNIATKKQLSRKRSPAVPQGVEKATFLKALEELSQQLGKENVEIADQPLKDGW
jgi:hypothetical protein